MEVIELVQLSLDVIERLSERGILRYMQDAAASMLSRLTAQLVSVRRLCFVRESAHLTKIHPRIPSALRPSIVSLLRRLCATVAKSAQGDPVAPTAFVARYVHHALETLSSRSRIASPLPRKPCVGQLREADWQKLLDRQRCWNPLQTDFSPVTRSSFG